VKGESERGFIKGKIDEFGLGCCVFFGVVH
jgi:hypothetical protein